MLVLAFRIYRERFADLAKAVAVVVVPASIFGTILLALLVPLDQSEAVRPAEFEVGESLRTEEVDPLAEVDGTDLGLAFAGLALGFGLGAMTAQLSTAAAFRMVAGEYTGDRPSWGQSLTYGFARFGPLIWLQVIYSVLLLIGFFFFVIPGIYLAVAWTLVVPVFVLERREGFGALSRSTELVRGRWWPTLGLLALVGGATAILTALLTPLLTAVLPANGDLAKAASEGVASGLVAVVTTPLAAVAMCVLYFDARIRKDGLGIAELRHELHPPARSEEW